MLAKDNYKKAFTLIELLLVVSIVGVLSGLVLTVINPKKQAARAADSVSRNNLEKMVQAVEAYCEAEGVCPTATGALPDFTNPASTFRSVYVKIFPEDDVSTSWDERINYGVSGTSFSLCVQKPSDYATKQFKYDSVSGSIRECGITGAPCAMGTYNIVCP